MVAAILAYSRTTYYFYAYYGLKTLISMVSDGSVQFLALAYVVRMALTPASLCTELRK